MKIKATGTRFKHLMPGDLFSNEDQEAWDAMLTVKQFDNQTTLGLRLFVRSNTKCPEHQRDQPIYRIQIIPSALDVECPECDELICDCVKQESNDQPQLKDETK